MKQRKVTSVIFYTSKHIRLNLIPRQKYVRRKFDVRNKSDTNVIRMCLITHQNMYDIFFTVAEKY